MGPPSSDSTAEGISKETPAAAQWVDRPATVVFSKGPPIQAVYVGPGLSLDLHRHYATQISISVGEPFRVRTSESDSFQEQESFVVGPNVAHELDAEGIPIVEIWGEVGALADFARHLSATSGSLVPSLPPELLVELRSHFLEVETRSIDRQAGEALLSYVFTQLLGAGSASTEGDPRIAHARSLVTPRFLVDELRPIDALASEVHLSTSRFRHLWREETGMSVQSYLRWQRLLAAMVASAGGASLTEAAHIAGFADSAHLSRVFRATFGITPSDIFKNSHFVQAILGDPR